MAYWQGYQNIAWHWAACAFSAILVVIRLYVDYKGLRNVSVYRDLLVVFALLCWTTQNGHLSVANDYNEWTTGDAWDNQPEKYQILELKVNWIAQIIGNSMRYICQIDLLFLYHELAPRSHHPKMFLLICSGWFIVISSWIVFILYMLLSCKPVSAYWDVNTTGTCLDDLFYYLAFWLPSILAELLVYIIPCIIIYRIMHMNFSQKLSAAAMFLVGFFNIVALTVSLATQIVIQKYWNAMSFERMWAIYGVAAFMGGVQGMTAMMVICMPQLKNFYRLVRASMQKTKGEIDGEKGGAGNSDETPDTPTDDVVVSGALISPTSSKSKEPATRVADLSRVASGST